MVANSSYTIMEELPVIRPQSETRDKGAISQKDLLARFADSYPASNAPIGKTELGA
jgi:hypothetical protein